MITEKKCCVKCGSDQIVKNGSNRVSNRKYKCKSCGFGGVFESKRKSEEFKEMVVRAAQERTSSRGLARTFGIGHTTALKWIKKSRTTPRHSQYTASFS
jgi:transposase-like protein